jgi:hypothetical protein
MLVEGLFLLGIYSRMRILGVWRMDLLETVVAGVEAEFLAGFLEDLGEVFAGCGFDDMSAS